MRICSLAAIAIGLGCGARARTRGDGCAHHDYSPHGAPADYTRPEVSGVDVAEPRLCESGNAYIRLTRTGRRTIGLTNSDHPVGCIVLPADPSDSTCPAIEVGTLVEPVRHALRARHIETDGPGVGACGQVGHSYEAWNVSISVRDWHDAATAVTLVAEQLARYDVGDFIGVSVEGETCGVAL